MRPGPSPAPTIRPGPHHQVTASPKKPTSPPLGAGAGPTGRGVGRSVFRAEHRGVAAPVTTGGGSSSGGATATSGGGGSKSEVDSTTSQLKATSITSAGSGSDKHKKGDPNEASRGRGFARGVRFSENQEITKTRPDHIVSKLGGGEATNLVTNYFKVAKSPGWKIYQYLYGNYILNVFCSRAID